MHRKPDGAWDKSRLPSRHVTEGPSRAPHRSYYYAMGLGSREIAQPFVGVASCWNEAAPCNTTLMRQAHAVSKGVKAAGGTPREFCTITVTDGIAMGHEGMRSSLVSREVIADSVELTIRGHAYDALVGVAGCDKSLPGMMMAMLRLNVPSVFLYGGSILPGCWRGKDVTIQDVFEGVGQHSAGTMSAEDLEDLERHACPGDGACGGQYTANTMACVSARLRAKWAACSVMAFATVLAASNAFASQHITTNACTVTTPTTNGTIRSARCQFPLQIPHDGVHGTLFVHRVSSTPSQTHTWWESNDESPLWNLNWGNGNMNSWCPGAQVKRTCATSSGGASSQVFTVGWRTFTYHPTHPSNDIEDMFCPSNKPFMIKAQADTSAWW